MQLSSAKTKSEQQQQQRYSKRELVFRLVDHRSRFFAQPAVSGDALWNVNYSVEVTKPKN